MLKVITGQNNTAVYMNQLKRVNSAMQYNVQAYKYIEQRRSYTPN